MIVDGVQKVGARPAGAADGAHRLRGGAARAPRRRTGAVTAAEGAAAGGAAPEIKYFFIRRPVLAGVISIVITLLGLFAIRLLPVSRYPQITPPGVQVSAVYPGATAQDVADAVAAPIEQQLPGLQGLLYFSSANASDGSMGLQISFDVDRNQDLAAVDVQNAVQLALPQLPDAVRQNGVTILKANTDILAVAALTSTDPRYDARVSHELPEAVSRGRAQAHPRDRQRADLRRPPVLDAAAARSGEDGASSRVTVGRRRRRGARAERDEPRRPPRARAGAAGDGDDDPDHRAGAAPDAGPVR